MLWRFTCFAVNFACPPFVGSWHRPFVALSPERVRGLLIFCISNRCIVCLASREALWVAHDLLSLSQIHCRCATDFEAGGFAVFFSRAALSHDTDNYCVKCFGGSQIYLQLFRVQQKLLMHRNTDKAREAHTRNRAKCVGGAQVFCQIFLASPVFFSSM